MNLIIEKIIKCYVRITYLFGSNLTKEQKEHVLSKLTKAASQKLDQSIIDFLLENDFNLRDTNLFLRRIQYCRMVNNADINEIERSIVLMANEEINRLKELNLSNEGVGMSLSSCQELLATASKDLVIANYINGAAYCCGLFGSVDKKLANEYLLKAAHSYYLDAFLLLAVNTPEERDYYYLIYNALNKINHKITVNNNQLLVSKVNDDLQIYNLINDDRSNYQIQLHKYNPFIEKVLFSNQFTLQEKRNWLFSKTQVEWNVICNLITTEKVSQLNNPQPSIRPLEKKQIHTVLEKMVRTNKPSPLIIESKDELMLSEVKTYIVSCLTNYYPIDINTKKFDIHSLQRATAKNNFLYNATKHHNSNLILTLIENLHSVKENVINDYNAFLYTDMPYYYYDIETEYNKDRLINVIFAKDKGTLNNALVTNSIVLSIKEANDDEKEYLITRALTNKLKRIGEDNINISDLVKILKEEAKYSEVKELINTFISKAFDKNDLTPEKLREIIKEDASINITGKIGFITRRVG